MTETATPEPTDTPAESTATPTATPTEMPGTFTADLALNSDMFHAGDMFRLSLNIVNGSAEPMDVEQYIILDVYGLYFFHPGWTEAGDYQKRIFESGYQGTDVVLEFTWPEGAGSADDLCFWMGFLKSGTMELACDIDQEVFSYR